MKKVLLATLLAAFSLGMSAQGFEYVPLDANTGRPLVPNVCLLFHRYLQFNLMALVLQLHQYLKRVWLVGM